jgi:hypothetical protein
MVLNELFQTNTSEQKVRYFVIDWLILLSLLLPLSSVWSQLPADSIPIYESSEVDKMPSFPGGETEMRKYLAEHLKHLQYPKDLEVYEKVVVRFVVDETGLLSQFEVVRNRIVGTDLIRVLQTMPCWIPGTKDGKPVRTIFILPMHIRFE